MLIKVKNADLYRAWVEYLSKTTDMAPYQIRTAAFFKSQNNEMIPFMGA